jgi:hypothetical protein
MSGAVWTGPDGTGATYYTAQQIAAIPSLLSGKRYLQYKVDFLSDKNSTPIFNQVEFTYQK